MFYEAYIVAMCIGLVAGFIYYLYLLKKSCACVCSRYCRRALSIYPFLMCIQSFVKHAEYYFNGDPAFNANTLILFGAVATLFALIFIKWNPFAFTENEFEEHLIHCFDELADLIEYRLAVFAPAQLSPEQRNAFLQLIDIVDLLLPDDAAALRYQVEALGPNPPVVRRFRPLKVPAAAA